MQRIKHEGPIMIHIKTQKEKVIHMLKRQMIIITEFQNLMLKLEYKKNLKLIFQLIQKYLLILLLNMQKEIVK